MYVQYYNSNSRKFIIYHLKWIIIICILYADNVVDIQQ